jgi:hypothetical protein
MDCKRDCKWIECHTRNGQQCHPLRDTPPLHARRLQAHARRREPRGGLLCVCHPGECCVAPTDRSERRRGGCKLLPLAWVMMAIIRSKAGLLLTPEGVTSIEYAVRHCDQWTGRRELTDQLRRYVDIPKP